MIHEKNIQRARRIIFLTSGLAEGAHSFTVELRRCWITDSVTFKMNISNNAPMDMATESGEIMVMPKDVSNVYQTYPVAYCTAKCQAVHHRIFQIIMEQPFDEFSKKKVFNNVYQLLLKTRRKMSKICFSDTWALIKEMLKRDCQADIASYLSYRNEAKVIVFDVEHLAVGLTELKVILKKGRVLEIAVFGFKTTDAEGRVSGFVHKKFLLRLVFKSTRVEKCSPDCQEVHNMLGEYRNKIVDRETLETLLPTLLNTLEEKRNQMNPSCFSLTEDNIKDVLKKLGHC